MFWSSEPKKELPPFEEREIPENLALNDEEKQVLAECFKICENGDTEEFLGQYDPYFFIRIVRGYKDYKPRIEETAKAMDKIVRSCKSIVRTLHTMARLQLIESVVSATTVDLRSTSGAKRMTSTISSRPNSKTRRGLTGISGLAGIMARTGWATLL